MSPVDRLRSKRLALDQAVFMSGNFFFVTVRIVKH